MTITRNIALALALALGVSNAALADVDENGTDISFNGAYAGASSISVHTDHYVPGSQSDENGGFVREVSVDIADFATAADSADEPRNSWEPGYWQDDDGLFRKL